MIDQGQALERLKKNFIISATDFAEAELELLINRTKQFCVVDENGDVHVRVRTIGRGKQLGVYLLGAFLASRLDDRFVAVRSADQIASSLRISKPEIFARAKELVDEGFVVREGKGSYRMIAARIADFLDLIEKEVEAL